ncbi:MAG: phosphoenolpyruvate hydrolase family protein [Verrucomicrobia bacterium]|nr:phosphoenolpyruvate hydrolase family protein [Verrucomicrobiota bacterium]
MNQLRQKIARREHLVGAAVGSGMSAQAAEAGGADLLMVLAAGHFRLQGRSSMAALLPFANSNALTWQIGIEQVLPCIRNIPLFFGVCAQDFSMDWDAKLQEAKDYGFAGITNFPSVIFFDGEYREALESAGLGFAKEVELLKKAGKHGLMTIGFCLSLAEARDLAQANVDIICLDLGFAEWQPPDDLAHQEALDDAIQVINQAVAAVKKINPDAFLVVLSGPVLLPQDTAQVYQRTDALGYVGGSTIERFPAAPIITQTVREFKMMAQAGKQMDRLGAMIGRSEPMQELFEKIRRVAESNAPILILGESGSGKELVAREIHRLSSRQDKPLVSWNCGAVTESLAMSELFGHEQGAFTGANRVHLGKFEMANAGTLFMDEVSDLPLSVQASLLRVLQEHELIRVGGQKTIRVDVRLIAACNKELGELIPDGKFRLDLYYRLSTVVLRIPSLRERREDIPFHVHEMMQEFSHVYGCPVPHISDSVMQALVCHSWPGNIRQLKNAMEHCFIIGRGKPVSLEWLEELFLLDRHLLGRSEKGFHSEADPRDRLMETLARNRGNKLAAARELGVSRKTIYNWLQSPRSDEK